MGAILSIAPFCLLSSLWIGLHFARKRGYYIDI
jgi:hypothetical protein